MPNVFGYDRYCCLKWKVYHRHKINFTRFAILPFDGNNIILHGVSFSPLFLARSVIFSNFDVSAFSTLSLRRQTEYICLLRQNWGNVRDIRDETIFKRKHRFDTTEVVNGYDSDGGEMWMNSMFLFIRSTPSQGIGTLQHINTLESIRP